MSTLLRFAKPSRAARWERQRGSVLILCVVLIVVLALIGTAMLSTARIDRYTSAQHSDNVQIELLMEGARQIAQSVILSDLRDSGTGAFRPPDTANGGTATVSYDHWDGLTLLGSGTTTLPLQNDAWLMSLAPSMLVRNTSGGSFPPTYAPESPIYWTSISAPLAGVDFEDPVTQATITANDNREYMAIDPLGRGLMPIDPENGTLGTRVTGGDADGDGMPDSLGYRLFPGEINGTRYYVYYRIVDNAAKINVNTAWSRAGDWSAQPANIGQRVQMFDPTPLGLPTFAGNLGIHRSHVGLMELLRLADNNQPAFNDTNAQDEMTALNLQRFGAGTGTNILAHNVAFDDPNIPPNFGVTAQRTEMEFPTAGGLMESQLARRLGNAGTGQFTVDGVPVPPQQFQPFDASDATALAYRFTLNNPDASRSKLENAFFDAYRISGLPSTDPDSLYRSAGNYNTSDRSYRSTDVSLWYDTNFNFHRAVGSYPLGAGSGSVLLNLDSNPSQPHTRPLRSILTPLNPVSNQIPPRSTADVGLPLALPSTVMPEYRPTPAKTNVNTASFQELWRAYWSVMHENTDSRTPFTIPAGTAYGQITYFGNQFDSTTGNPTIDPFVVHPAHMFRSPLRDMRNTQDHVYLSPEAVVRLRSAVAAVNTIDLRDADQEVTRERVDIPIISGREMANVDGAPTALRVYVYGVERQPFITEIYVNNDNKTFFGGGTNPKAYVAIELYNPYPEPIDIGGWGFAVMDRRPEIEPGPEPTVKNPYPGMDNAGRKGLSYFYIHAGPPNTNDGGPIEPPTPLPLGTTVPPNGFLVLHNKVEGGGDPGENAWFYPTYANGGFTQPVSPVYVENLHWVLQDANVIGDQFKEGRGGELVLIRPVDPALPMLLENNNAAPVDSFDFTGMVNGMRAADISGAPAEEVLFQSYRYVRSNGTPGGPANWKFVYPGRYHGDSSRLRQQGIQEESWLESEAIGDEQIGLVNLEQPDADATYKTIHTIQVFDRAGPHPVTATGNQFPFGGFARNGDILQVPYIGSYQVVFDDDPASTLEINPITVDSAFANDSDALLDPTLPAPSNNSNDERVNDASTPEMERREQVGRFCPVHDPAGGYDDLDDDGDYNRLYTDSANKWRYRWTLDLFDYLTVDAPSHDYLPNVEPQEYATTTGRAPQPVRNTTTARAAADIPPYPAPGPTWDAVINGPEDHVPLHGLININTAPWWVLSAIPWVRGSAPSPPAAPSDQFRFDDETGVFEAGQNFVDDNIDIAKAIARYRDGSPTSTVAGIPEIQPIGPFKTIFDLYKVPVSPPGAGAGTPPESLLSLVQQTIAGTDGPDDDEGDFSPFNSPGSPNRDGARFDFEEQFLIMNKVSNLITTRSDSYTVYILVEGYRGPEKVVQRRSAFIFDRSGITPQGGAATTLNVPTD